MRWTIDGPDSSYSCLEIHICWNVLSDARMLPPIHTLYLRSGGATLHGEEKRGGIPKQE